MTATAKILLIDDEADISTLLSKRIRKAGYEVVCHYEGLNAFDMVRTTRPDLILLDIRLPEISGMEIYKTLRGDNELKKIPIIFLSALHEEEALCIQAGAEGFIRKPSDSSVMLETIQRALRTAS